jgi:hypothetical protein
MEKPATVESTVLKKVVVSSIDLVEDISSRENNL